MLNYQEAVRLISEYWKLGTTEFKFTVCKSVEYPFGWLFFFDTLLTDEEQDKIGKVYFVLSGIYPSIVEKKQGKISLCNPYVEPPFHSNRVVKQYALKYGYEWKPEWEVEFDMNDKSISYLKFE